MSVLNLVESTGTDDGSFSENTSTYDNSSVAATLGYYSGPRGIWALFGSVSGLSGATISSAILTYQRQAISGTLTACTVYAEDVTSSTYPTSAADAQGRTRTTAGVSFNPAANPDTADIASVIQELADSYDPSTILILHDSSEVSPTKYYNVYTYDSSSSVAPTLDITYTASGGGGGTTVIKLAGEGGLAGYGGLAGNGGLAG